MLITIVTPSYNRSNELPALYTSLCNQTDKDFLWLVIDDGSTDETECYIKNISDNSLFAVEYIKKANGGKHSALNIAFRTVKSELLFIVDSDDVLVEDAIATIRADWEKAKKTNKGRNLCGLGYLRGYTAEQWIGDKYSGHFVFSNFIDERYNRGIDGDKAEVWVTECLRDFQYPEIEGEKFISESVAWIWLAKKYDMLFINRIIYITEYLSGGLSDSGRALRFRCPNLMAYGSLMTMSKEFSAKIRVKETLLYIVYSLFGKKSFKDIFSCDFKLLVGLCYAPGLLLYEYWKRKYRIENE